MIQVPRLSEQDIARWIQQPVKPSYRNSYYAMYSSVFGGIVVHPMAMLIPIDDHLVHRGDGVFETCKYIRGAIYNWKAHQERLRRSAEGIALKVPWSDAELTEIVVQTVRAGQRADGLIRVLIARGPGSFGVNPYDCPEPALYVVASEWKAPFMETHPQGARVCRSRYPVKPGAFAQIKSSNYLINVLMKKEAVDAGVDFVAGFDEEGFLTEGATENFGIVTSDRRLLVPKPERILMGTTMVRVLELADELVSKGTLAAVGHADISYEAVRRAAEVLIFGTTPDVTAVVEFDGAPIGAGVPGPVWRRLADLLRMDMFHNPERRTETGLSC